MYPPFHPTAISFLKCSESLLYLGDCYSYFTLMCDSLAPEIRNCVVDLFYQLEDICAYAIPRWREYRDKCHTTLLETLTDHERLFPSFMKTLGHHIYTHYWEVDGAIDVLGPPNFWRTLAEERLNKVFKADAKGASHNIPLTCMKAWSIRISRALSSLREGKTDYITVPPYLTPFNCSFQFFGEKKATLRPHDRPDHASIMQQLQSYLVTSSCVPAATDFQARPLQTACVFYHKALLNSALFKVDGFGNRKRRADSYVRCDWLVDETKALMTSYGVLRFIFHHEGFADEADNQTKTVSGTYAYVDWWLDLDSGKSYQQLRKERTLRRVRPVTQRELHNTQHYKPNT